VKEHYYIVAEEILSEAMQKTVRVKELLKSGEESQIKQAVNRVGLSRSAYYKYKDYIFSFHQQEQQQLITLSLLAVDKKGVLSKILTKIADYRGNILTINQDLPLAEVAHITLTLEVDDLSVSLDKLLTELREAEGIKQAKVVTKTFK